ncbi:MAG: BlaI/MecI/CopY family transcriptional regulator [Candidatus Kerfeldbacteria bacterium]|nr:BlaI/MecI/CopY family transcriptional regulator [Candidatus Kerfeldbacteria bacterium]
MTLGELEKRVMDIFWSAQSNASLSVRDVLDSINRESSDAYAYNTILTVITHLFEKKMLKRQPAGKAFTYTAACSKTDFVARTSSNLFSQMEKEYGALAVAHFVRYMENVDPKILEEARRLIEKE